MEPLRDTHAAVPTRKSFTVTPAGSFTLSPDDELNRYAVDDLASVSQIALNALKPFRVLGLILTGSVARGEGTLLPDHDCGRRWLSDLEFQVVSADHCGRETELDAALKQLEVRISSAPESRARNLRVGFSNIRASQISRLRPAIFSREMLEHGKLLWGQPSAIALPHWWCRGNLDIPRSDALRLLQNRIVQKIAARSSSIQGSPAGDNTARYLLSKFWIDLATSLSIFVGRYNTSYQGRRDSMTEYFASPEQPFGEMGRLLAFRLSTAVDIKLGRASAPLCSEQSFDEAAAAAAAVWNWETNQLINSSRSPSGWFSIFERLRQTESHIQRIRDWGRFIVRRTYTGSLPATVSAALRSGSLASAIYGAACVLDFFWGGFDHGAASNETMFAYVAKLLSVKARPGPEGRNALVNAVTAQWDRHLRFAPR
jgi:hypothetical protein